MEKKASKNKTPEEEYDGFQIYETETFRLKAVFKQLCNLRFKKFNIKDKKLSKKEK